MPGYSVAIVGAGIGGLTTALKLARQGHAVTLVERRTGFSEVGAGLQLSPNASRILIELGLGAALRRAAGEPEQVVVRSIRSGRDIGHVALGSFMRERFGAPYWVVHRADLQTILLDAVRSQPSIRLVMGRKVEDVTDELGQAQLMLSNATGARETLTAAAVIGADGLWSKIGQILGQEAPAFRGYVAWRATLGCNEVPAALARNETGLWLGREGHIVHYPIAGGRLLNVVAIQRTLRPVEGWSTPGDGAELLSHYVSACPLLRELLTRIGDWHLWSLFDRRAEGMAKGRIALIGDAAHPVLPFLAQGAALAIEDAAALTASMNMSGGDFASAFMAFERDRLARVRKVQDEARRNGKIYHLGRLTGLVRNQVMRRVGPEGMTGRYSWLYGY